MGELLLISGSSSLESSSPQRLRRTCSNATGTGGKEPRRGLVTGAGGENPRGLPRAVTPSVNNGVVPVVALLPGDPEFGARNICDWVTGGTPEGVRWRRVEQRIMDAGVFLPAWPAWLFTATKSGDREYSGCEH